MKMKLQSIVVGFLASVVACLSEYFGTGHFKPLNLLSI